MAHPISNEIHPLPHIIMMMAKAADDDCITIVINIPATANKTMEPKPISVYSRRKANVPASNSGTLELMYSRPKNKSAKPMPNSAIDFVLLFLENMNGIATPISGRIKSFTFICTPKTEINQAVAVVPTLAPIITAIESASDIRPALTKLTTITVDAEEL